jgi:soluble lytic murein transglycosylase-like protein
MNVESDFRADTVGAAGEIGLMQVLPATARLLGFMGSDRELAEPATNIRLGVTYLARAWRLAEGDLCRALMKYRASHGEDQMTPLSLEYCRRVREHLNLLETEPHAKPRTTAPPQGRAFWIAHEARIKAITTLVHERWALMQRRPVGPDR